jgi:hypothetical protein
MSKRRQVCRATLVEMRYRHPSVGKLAPQCQLGSTNNLTKNSGIGCARSISADIIKIARAYRYALAPLIIIAQEDWHHCVTGAFAGIFKRVQAASSEGKCNQVQPNATKCVALKYTIFDTTRRTPYTKRSHAGTAL